MKLWGDRNYERSRLELGINQSSLLIMPKYGFLPVTDLRCRPVAQTPIAFIDGAAQRVVDSIDWEHLLPGYPVPPIERMSEACELAIEFPYRYLLTTELLNGRQQRRFRMSVEFAALNLDFTTLLGDAAIGCLADHIGGCQIAEPQPRFVQVKRDGVKVFVYSIEFTLMR